MQLTTAMQIKFPGKVVKKAGNLGSPDVKISCQM